MNVINQTGGIVVGGIGQGINFVGGTASTIGDRVRDFFDDGLDAVTSFFR